MILCIAVTARASPNILCRRFVRHRSHVATLKTCNSETAGRVINRATFTMYSAKRSTAITRPAAMNIGLGRNPAWAAARRSH